jgi:hypothetical protein
MSDSTAPPRLDLGTATNALEALCKALVAHIEGDGRAALQSRHKGLAALLSNFARKGSAIGFALASSSKSDTANSLRDRVGHSGCADGTASASDCSALQDAVNAKDRDRNWSTAGIILAGVAAVATPTYWFLWPHSNTARESRSRGVGFRASASSAGANIWISGQF